jgi:glycosyltransferase involved in cell wall biosynthesis
MPIHVGDNLGEFSPAAARNHAARLAGDWDVAVFHDSDTIAHPDAIAQAVNMAANTMQMVVAADSHMYCDKPSSQRIMASGSPAFARPASFDERGIYLRPCSGVFAVNRELFDRVGGYVESLHGWGYEDLVFLQQCGIFGDGNTWVPGHITLHLWHPPAEKTSDTATNKAVWHTLTKFRRMKDPTGAAKYLATLGHVL